jgi:hypothetical protein
MNTDIQFTTTTTEAEIKIILKTRRPQKATHARILPEGGKRAKIVSLKNDDILCWNGVAAIVQFGIRDDKTEKFTVFELREPPTNGEVETKVVRTSTGFIKAIDDMLLDLDDKGPQDGFLRSKHSVDQAHAAIMQKFPGKNPESVKKIIKVRPRHLEKSKIHEFTDEFTAKPESRSPRWALVSSTPSYILAIDDALTGANGPVEGEIKVSDVVNYVQSTSSGYPEGKSLVKLIRRRAMALRRKGLVIVLAKETVSSAADDGSSEASNAE